MQDNDIKEIEVTYGTVSTERFEMRYFRFGEGKRAMVILPGLSIQSVMGSAESVAQEYAAFSDEFTVYVFDRREAVPSPYTLKNMASDTSDAFMLLGLSNIYLFGASQGGMIALCIAQDHPELVSELILGSSACRVSAAQFAIISSWVSLARQKDRKGLFLSFGEKLYPREIFESFRGIFELTADNVTDEELRKFIILSEGTEGFDVSDRMDLITCPVLSLDSEDDKVLGPEAGQLIKEKLKDHRSFSCYTYSGFGHAAFDTAAPEYQERMLQFFLGE